MLNITDHEFLGDNILIVATSFEDDVIINPAQYEDKPSYGVVLAVGQGRILDTGVRVEPSVKKGDFVMFSKFGTTKERIDGVDYFYLREDDIISRTTI